MSKMGDANAKEDRRPSRCTQLPARFRDSPTIPTAVPAKIVEDSSLGDVCDEPQDEPRASDMVATVCEKVKKVDLRPKGERVAALLI